MGIDIAIFVSFGIVTPNYLDNSRRSKLTR